MSDTKYVVGLYRDPRRRSGPEGRFFEEVTAVVFDASIAHSDMEMLFLSVHSAGFFRVDPATSTVRCSGRSESLGIDSKPAIDEYYVASALGLRLPASTPPLSPADLRDALVEERRSRFSKR